MCKEIKLDFRKHEYDEFQCEITDFCEDYLVFERKHDARSFMATYLCAKERFAGRWLFSIRRPGATRGHIEVDDNDVIVDIVIYDDSGIAHDKPNNVGCYREELKEAIKKYIGCKIIT